MTNVFKKIVSVGVTMSTLFWSVGVSALLPVAASAATCQSFSSGDLVKVTGKPAIYAVDSNGKLLWFPTGDEFKSWNSDEKYGGYTSVTQECFDALPVPSQYPAGVNFRPGSFVVKRASSDQLYVVLPGNKLSKVTSAVASALYGSGYKVKTVQDTFWNNYTGRGADVTEAIAHPGMLVSNGGKTWYVDADSKLWEVTAAGMSANRFKTAFIRPVTSAMLAGLSTGGTLSAVLPALADRSQTGGAPGATPVGGGALSVALDSSNPAGVNLADSTGLNPILKVSLRAGSSAVKVTGLTLNKSGFISNTVVSGVEVVDSSGVRHGNVASSINADNQVTLLFTGSPIVVPANGMEVATIRVNFGNVTTNGTLRLSLASASAVTADGSVSGAFPINSNEFSVFDGANSVAAVTLDAQSVNASGQQVNVDPLNWQDIAKFSLQETTSKEKVLVKEWTIYNNGTASDSDIKDIQLVAQDGSVLSTAQQSNKSIRFVLAMPYEIDKGLTKNFTVRAKILDGAARTIQFTTYNNYDVVVVGKDSGASLLASAGSTDTTFPIGDPTSVYNKATIGSGALSFNKDVTSPSVAVVPGASNVMLAKFYAKPTGENMELRSLNFAMATGTVGTFTGSITIRVNGASVAVVTPADIANYNLAGSPSTTVTLSTYPTLTSGQNNYITVEGNISSNATNGATTTVYMKLVQVKRLITNDITDLGVSVVAGNQMSVQAAALKVTNLSTPVTQSLVAGTTNVELAHIELNSGVVSSGEDVKVSALVVSQTGSGSVTAIGNLVMYGADGQPLTTSASTATGAASTTFTFVNPITVPKTGSVVLKLKGDILTNSGSTHVFTVNNTLVTAVGKETGNTVTPSGTGSGQTLTLTGSGVLTLSMVSGVGGSPANDQIVTPGQSNVSVFAFKLTAQNEPIKLTTLRLMASGTTWSSTNNLVNIKLYRNSETQPFASASQMLTGPGASTSTVFTWTATDNILPEAVQPGSPVTIYVKADVGIAGQVKIGEGFQFGISSTSTANIVAKGASSGATLDNRDTSKISGAPLLATGVSYIAPFQVLASAEAPTAGSSVTQSIIAGTQIARIKLMNNGGSKVTITGIKFTDSGTHTGTTTSYTLKYSSQNSNDYTANTASSTGTTGGTPGDSVDWKTGFMNTFDIDGGAYRYVTVSIRAIGAGTTGDNWQLSIASIGDITFSTTETDLGYDANLSGTLSGSITGLYADGKPIMGTLVKSS